jgi:chromosome partitioning protein
VPIVTVYNNKGGVGKSTLTVGLAEFLAGNRKRSVLVIDLDAQASSSNALLGDPAVVEAVRARHTACDLFAQAIRARRPVGNVADYLATRPAVRSRGTPLGSVAVLVADKPGIIELEEQMTRQRDVLALRDYLRPALRGFDFVLIDLPGNVDRRNRLVLAALVMSDFVLVPVEPAQISLSALPDTFDLVHHAQDLGRDGRPAVLGLVLNKTDRRTEQYRSKLPPILEAAGRGALPPVFENIIPDTPALATSTDATREFLTLKDRFDTYYDHVRRVAVELEERCGQYQFRPGGQAAPRFGQRIRELFRQYWRRGHPRDAATTG